MKISLTDRIQEEWGLFDRAYGPARHRGEFPLLKSPTFEKMKEEANPHKKRERKQKTA